jgi:hypothetical protein
MLVHLLLEGRLEEPVAEKLLAHCGHEKGFVYGQKGCAYLHEKAKGFQRLAQPGCGVLALMDFRDTGTPCPSDALRNKLSLLAPPPNFLCRMAIYELESWLLADAASLSGFLGISVSAIPRNPEMERLPKQTLVNLARRSRKTAIRDSIVPGPDHCGTVAPAYLATMTEFINEHWNIAVAAQNSPSLNRCVLRLQNLHGC